MSLEPVGSDEEDGVLGLSQWKTGTNDMRVQRKKRYWSKFAAVAILASGLTTSWGCRGDMFVEGGTSGEVNTPGEDGLDPLNPNNPSPPSTSDPDTPILPGDMNGDACEDPLRDAPPPARLWRLNADQYANTMALFFNGRPADYSEMPGQPGGVSYPLRGANEVDRFSTRSRSYNIDGQEFELVKSAATNLTAQFVNNLPDDYKDCLEGGRKGRECQEDLVRERGALLFGRPLTKVEVEGYLGMAERAALSPSGQLILIIRGMLLSPRFLFRTETGLDAVETPEMVEEVMGERRVRLTPHEIANALSYTLLDAPPDQELYEAAESGALSDPEEIRRQVERLASPMDKREPIVRFFREYWDYTHAIDVAKERPDGDAKYEPEKLVEDIEALVRHVIETRGQQGLLDAFLTTTDGFIQKDTAALYGMESESKDPELVQFDADERMGIMSQPAWLASYSETDHNNPIRRGVFIRGSMLCLQIPQIPIEGVEPLEISEEVTLRDALNEHASNPSCAGCHAILDPMGFPFEQYDHYGRFRTEEAGAPVDTRGALVSSGDQDGEVSKPQELLESLSASERVEQCFVAHAFQYWMGRAPGERDACAMQEAVTAYRDSEGDYLELLKTLYTSDAFLMRTVPEDI